MIRRFSSSLAAALVALCCAQTAAPALAKDKPADAKSPAKPDAGKTVADKPNPKKAEAKTAVDGKKIAEAKKPDAGKEAKNSRAKPSGDKGAAKTPAVAGTYGDWNAMTAQGKDKTCYALAEPKDRQPGKLQRDKAYIFISTRPGEGVRNEVAIILGFPVKDGGAATADIDGVIHDLVTKGANAWVKNPAKEKEFVEAMKNGAKLVIKAPSVKGNVTTDTYSLKGVSDALARVQKDCP